MEEEENKKGLKIFFSLVIIIFMILLLIFYWFIPFNTIEFGLKPGSSNFSLNALESKGMQFYENMRYPNPEISYKIHDCPLQKQDDMLRAFEIISNKSILTFYPVVFDEEISVTCDSKTKVEGGMFIAGEGGPTNITKSGEFNVIFHGKILLIRESKCEKPNIAIHELLHALGFDHSENPNNIMYNVSKCRQNIGGDTIELINELYFIQSYPDISFGNVSAVMHGKYLDTNISIRNDGLKDSEDIKIIIYADEKLVKEIELEPLEIGYGKLIMLKNIWISKININELEFLIDYSFEELNKKNNEIKLEIKK